ncbi:hypothetical protein AB1286_33170 [Trinickia sp. NRRL B-1857]|uniref:hypothetical protein n=1 Tax=Trinickia sp. NRRL B-1857 TaxID=3162879 RepID=UPI003D26EC49
MLGDIGDFVSATAQEIGHHPLQAAGAALGVPGYDPFFGGLFNNHPGGALLSPTGNFTSSAWGDMYKDNPNSTGALDAFHRVNSVADVVAPMIAGGYASGALGGTGGSSGFANVFGNSGTDALGPSSIQGSGPLFGLGSGMGGSTLTGTAAPEMASASPYAASFGGSSMAYPFTMPTSDMSPWLRMGSQLLQQQSQQAQQRAQQSSNQPNGMQGYANPQAVLLPSTPAPTINQQMIGRMMLANAAGAMGGY